MQRAGLLSGYPPHPLPVGRCIHAGTERGVDRSGAEGRANVRLEQIEQLPTVEFFHTIPLLSLCSSASGTTSSQAAAAQTSPSPTPSGATRGVAFANKGDEERQGRTGPARSTANDKVMFLDGNDYPASQLLATLTTFCSARLRRPGDTKAAVAKFTEAVADRTPCPTPSCRSGITRRASRSAALRKPASLLKPKPSPRHPHIRTMAGRRSGLAQALMRKARQKKPTWA